MVTKEFCDNCEKVLEKYHTARIEIRVRGIHQGDWSDDHERVACSLECAKALLCKEEK